MKPKAVSAPAYLTTGAIYQINPRTFSDAGTLRAITEELPFLASLGMKTIYLCPVFEADASENRENWSVRQKASKTDNPKNPYRMNDYFRIDCEYGTMDDLEELIAESHRLGMRVMLDLVYLHIGPNARILKLHPEFAKQNPDGSFIMGPWNFPLFNFENEGLREYLLCNMTYYIGVLDADGFRCDVGDGVPLDFWEEGKKRIRKIKPDAVMLNEGAKAEYLLSAFDATYGFSWHQCLYEVFGKQKPASALQAEWTATNERLPAGALVMRDIDNHDTVTDWPKRTELLAGHDGMDVIELLNFFLDGVPMVYCGNELCDTTTLNMFANRFHPGVFSASPRGKEQKESEIARRRQDIIRTMNAWRSSDTLLYCGETEWLSHDRPDSVILVRRYEKKTPDTEEKSAYLLANLSEDEQTVTLGDALALPEICVFSSGVRQTGDHTYTIAPHGYLLKRT